MVLRPLFAASAGCGETAVRKPAEKRSCAAALRRERRHATAVSLAGGGEEVEEAWGWRWWKVLEGTAEEAMDGGGGMRK
jgi:hypothetical protein